MDPTYSSRALALGSMARGLVLQVASDSGKSARPGLAEAFLLAAEVEVFISETIAATPKKRALQAEATAPVRGNSKLAWNLIPHTWNLIPRGI